MRDNNLWKEIGREMHTPRNEKVPMAPIHCILALWTVPCEQLAH